MSRGPDAATLLERALLADARRAGCALAILEATCTRWASATFTGMRHQLSLSGAATPAFADWLSQLAEAEFALRGHVLADIACCARTRRGETLVVRVEALTVETQ